jgi:hypothetical protein
MSDNYLGEWGEATAGEAIQFADDEQASGTPPASESRAAAAAELVFGSLETFVVDYLLAMYRRAVSGTGSTWCAQWWRHPEAVVRLEALWRSWEYLRQDPATGISVWLRDHADYHMSVLLSADGPFKGCTETQHAARPLRPLQCASAPAGALEPAGGPGGLAGEL